MCDHLLRFLEPMKFRSKQFIVFLEKKKIVHFCGGKKGGGKEQKKEAKIYL